MVPCGPAWATASTVTLGARSRQRAPTVPLAGPSARARDQSLVALMACCWLELVTSIRRALAFSATGIVSVNTPLS